MRGVCACRFVQRRRVRLGFAASAGRVSPSVRALFCSTARARVAFRSAAVEVQSREVAAVGMATLGDIAIDCASFVPDEQRRSDTAKAACNALEKAGFGTRESLVYAEFIDLGTLAEATGPARAVIRRILAVVKEGSPALLASNSGAAARSEAAAVVHVNLEERVAALNLAGLPHELKPPSALVDQLATDIARLSRARASRREPSTRRPRRLKRQGISAPFIACDLRKFLPSWCADKNAPR